MVTKQHKTPLMNRALSSGPSGPWSIDMTHIDAFCGKNLHFCLTFTGRFRFLNSRFRPGDPVAKNIICGDWLNKLPA